MYVRVLGKLSLLSSLEAYLCYLINIITLAIKEKKKIRSKYPLIYSEQLDLEKEAPFLVGFEGTGPVMVGPPAFNPLLDQVSPLGSVLLSLCYIFYDIRFTKLRKSTNYDFVQNVLMKVADRAYSTYTFSVKEHLSYLLDDDSPDVEEQKEEEVKGEEESPRARLSKQLKEISRLGVNTYSLVLVWAGLKCLATLTQRIAQKSKYVVNYKAHSHEEEK